MEITKAAWPRRRRLTGVTGLVVAALVLTACGAGGSPSPGSSDGNELVVLVEGGGHTALPPVAELFTRETGVEVTFVELPYENMYERINSELVSGNTSFDVAAIGGELLPAFASEMEPMDELFTDELVDDLFPSLMEEARFEAGLVGMPIWTNAELLYYRTDLFEDTEQKREFEAEYGYELAPPATWQEFADVAQFFTQDTDSDGKPDLYGADVKGGEDAEWLATTRRTAPDDRAWQEALAGFLGLDWPRRPG